MRLHARPFKEIKNGEKTSEFRVNDEKRQSIQVGGLIEFTNRDDSNDRLIVEVTCLKTYPSFKDLFHRIKDFHLNWDEEEFVRGMHQYYTIEEEVKYGVLEIEFKLVSN